MDINLTRYEQEVTCDHNSCSMRYRLSGQTMGVMRYTYALNVGKRIKQDFIILREMDIDRLIGEIVFDGGFSPELGESIVIEIKERSLEKVSKYVKETRTESVGQPASD